jgi:hypothetical protein
LWYTVAGCNGKKSLVWGESAEAMTKLVLFVF